VPDLEKENQVTSTGSPRVSRRAVIGGLVAAAVLPTIVERAWGQAPSAAITATPPPFGSAILPYPRQMHTATAMAGGYVLICGGQYNDQILGSAQMYRPNGTWIDLPSLITARTQHAAVLLSHNRVLVCGGIYQGTLDDAEIYDAGTNTWTAATPMQIPRYAHQATQITPTQILITGGYYQGTLGDPEIYLFS